MSLLPLDDVRDLLPQQSTLGDPQLVVAMKLVGSWIRTATGLTDLPDPLPEDHDLYAPALELVSLVITNPENLERSEMGGRVRWWSRSPRRDAILAELHKRYRRGATLPAGEFPCAQSWPDPVRIPAPFVWQNL